MVKNRLREIRMREFMMEQKEFAIYIGIGLTTYFNWEKGTRQPPLEKALEVAN